MSHPIFLLLVLIFFQGENHPEKIKALERFKLNIPEPSDICPHPARNHFFVVSDRGFLYETDSAYRPIRRTRNRGYDYEGVFADDKFVYAIEERTRRINQFDLNTFELVKSKEIRYEGGRNAGYEGFTFNKSRRRFVLVTEKRPIWVFELDENFQTVHEFLLKDKLKGSANSVSIISTDPKSVSEIWKEWWSYKGPSDVSSIGYYNDKIFILSDEDSELLQVNPNTYELEKRWSLGVLNPEGFYFGKDQNLYVMSDNLQQIFRFHPLNPK